MPPSSGHDEGQQFVLDSETTEGVIPFIDKFFYNDSGSTIPANKAVSVDLSKTPRWTRIRQYTGTIATDGPLIVGVSVADIPDKKWGKVRVRGEIQCEVDGAVVAGTVLQAGADAGRLAEQSATFAVTHRQIAIASEADTANVGNVFVLANGLF